VAGVADEPAHPLLRGLGGFLRGRRGIEGHLDLGEHAVQRRGKTAHLGAVAPVRDAAVQVTGRNGRGGCLHLGQRSQTAPHHQVTEHGQQQQHRQPDAELQEDEAVHGRAGVGQARGHGDHAGAAVDQRRRHRHHPPFRSAAH